MMALTQPAKDMLQSYHYTGAEKGAHLLVLGAIHGDEPCGTIAIHAMMKALNRKTLTLKKGSITFVPQCNPLAAAGKQAGMGEGVSSARYINHNLNRIIGHYDGAARINAEHAYADQVASFIDGCDKLLDIHSFHTDGPPFVFEDYETQDVQSLALATGLRDIVVGWPALYGAATENDTVGYACARKKPAILIECGQHNDPESIGVAYRVIHNVLVNFGYIDAPMLDAAPAPRRIRVQDMTIKTKHGGFTKPYTHLSPITKGEVLAAYSDGHTVSAPYDGFIIMPAHHAAIGDEWFYTGTLLP